MDGRHQYNGKKCSSSLYLPVVGSDAGTGVLCAFLWNPLKTHRCFSWQLERKRKGLGPAEKPNTRLCSKTFFRTLGQAALLGDCHGQSRCHWHNTWLGNSCKTYQQTQQGGLWLSKYKDGLFSHTQRELGAYQQGSKGVQLPLMLCLLL